MTKRIRVQYQFATAKHLSELGKDLIEFRKGMLKKWSGPDLLVDLYLPRFGPHSVESRVEAALTVPEFLRGAIEAERNGYDVIIVSCFSDPGMEAARELVSIPVIGSGICAMTLAVLMGSRFSIIAPGSGTVPTRGYENPKKYGFNQSLSSIRRVGMSVMDLAKDRTLTLKKIIEVGKLAVSEDKADTLILGCMSMAFHDVTEEISSGVGVPVINPITASLYLAECLVKSKISHSDKAYPKLSPQNINQIYDSITRNP